MNKISDLGEVESLKLLLANRKTADCEIVGPGDDAAFLKTADTGVLLSCDLMVEGLDFRLDWSSGFSLGFKAAATNLTDIAAMGGVPESLLVAVSAPRNFDIKFFKEMLKGFESCCKLLAPGCAIVGGDLSSGSSLVIAVTVTGSLPTGVLKPVLRSGAKIGDVIAVAGELGAAAAGLNLLQNLAVNDFKLVESEQNLLPVAEILKADKGLDNQIVSSQSSAQLAARVSNLTKLSEAEKELIFSQLEPKPPVDLGRIAALSGVNAMIDVSDGLVKDVGRIALASGVAVELLVAELMVDADRIATATKFSPQQSLDFVLSGGEDHAMLAAFDGQAELPAGFRKIGVVTKPSAAAAGAGNSYPEVKLVDSNGKIYAGDFGSGWDSVVGTASSQLKK